MVLERPVAARGTDLRSRRLGVLVRVHVCGVCRTDLHVMDGELPRAPLVPGHQIVGHVDATAGRGCPRRVGVPWLGWTCGSADCVGGRENLCEPPCSPATTATAASPSRADERLLPPPRWLPRRQAAPLLCAGLIGQALRMTGDARAWPLRVRRVATACQVARHEGRRSPRSRAMRARRSPARWGRVGRRIGRVAAGARRRDHLRPVGRWSGRAPRGAPGRVVCAGSTCRTSRVPTTPVGRARAPVGREPHSHGRPEFMGLAHGCPSTPRVEAHPLRPRGRCSTGSGRRRAAPQCCSRSIARGGRGGGTAPLRGPRNRSSAVAIAGTSRRSGTCRSGSP